jgi:hypothetical protein
VIEVPASISCRITDFSRTMSAYATMFAALGVLLASSIR